MAKRDSSEVREWIKKHQGKHFCECGCGSAIQIKRHQLYHGIPKFVRGHCGRLCADGALLKDRKQWVIDQQRKHLCNCGCGKFVSVTLQSFYRGIPEYVRGHHPNSGRSGKYTNDSADFWNLVSKDSSDCWEWLGNLSDKGYGRFYFQGRRWAAHRLSFYLFHKRLPNALLCHKCDNPKCVRPDHLFQGTQEDNMQDAAVKGRMARKITAEMAMKVATLVRSGVSRTTAAHLTGVSYQLTCKIMDGSVWSQVTGIEKKKRKYYGR